MTKTTFNKGIAILIANFPEKEIRAEITYPCLSDLTDEQFTKAIFYILKTEKQITKATNIIALIREKALIEEKPLAGDAWLEVQSQIMSIGSYGKPTFGDPLTDKAVAIMGWRNLCLSQNQVADRAHFFKIYDTLVMRDKKHAVIGKMNFDGKKRIEDLTKKILEKK